MEAYNQRSELFDKGESKINQPEIGDPLKSTNKEVKEMKNTIDSEFLESIDQLIKYLDKENLKGEISDLVIDVLLIDSLQELYSSEKGSDRDREMLHFMTIFEELNKEIVARPDAETQKPNWTIFRNMIKDMFSKFTFNDTRIQKEKESGILKAKIEANGLKTKKEYQKIIIDNKISELENR